LNLKNPKAYELASKLAELTGQSLTAAVLTAREARLEAERGRPTDRSTADHILAFARTFAPGMSPAAKSSNHADFLYGEDGMPR
jgi:antitoxin VapB